MTGVLTIGGYARFLNPIAEDSSVEFLKTRTLKGGFTPCHGDSTKNTITPEQVIRHYRKVLGHSLEK